MPGKKLLVADDSLTIQKVIRLALSNEGYEIQAVSEGNDTLQQISLFRPDLVLIDVSLPGKSAFEVKRAINSEPDYQEIRFVLMSSAFEKVDESQVEEVEFHGRLTKPFDPAHLRQVLSNALSQVTAKRMEKTSFLDRKVEDLAFSPPPPPLEFDEVSEIPPPPPGPSTEDPFPAIQPEFPTLDPLDLPPLPPEASDGESDIKELTETTMRLSGMDDFQWSVKEPSIKSLSDLAETEKATLPSESPPLPLESALPEISQEFPQDLPLEPPVRLPSVDPEKIKEMISHQISEQLSQQVSQEVEAVIKKMAQSLLPEVAEKIIKQEIHRLLSDD